MCRGLTISNNLVLFSYGPSSLRVERSRVLDLVHRKGLIMCKWNGKNDIKVFRNEVLVKDAQERMKIEVWARENLHNMTREDCICEVCGIVDPCVDNGICAECRQGMEIG